VTGPADRPDVFELLLELSSAGVALVDDDGRPLLANRRMQEITGFSAAQATRIEPGLIIADAEARERTLRRFMAGEEVPREEVQIVCADGTRRTVIQQLRPAMWQHDRVWLAVVEDVTSERRSATALQQSERRYQQISELISDFAYAFEVAEDGSLHLEWNTGALERLTGYSLDELIGLGGWDAVVHPADADVPHAQLERLRAGEVSVVEYRILTRGGHTRRMRDHGRPQWDPQQARVVRIYGAVQDITERHALREQLARLQKMEAVGTMVGGLVLDFNNVLTSIMGQASLLRSESQPGQRGYESAQIIERAAGRAVELTDQLLHYARGGMGRQVSVDMQQVVRDAVALVGRGAGAAVRISHEQLIANATVMGDPAELQRVVTNLLVNARDAIADLADTDAEITVVCRQIKVAPGDESAWGDVDAGVFLELEIADSGEGIPEDDLERIFEPYFTTKPRGHGQGLGLATAYSIVRTHGGAILVESDQGYGTTFRVLLPLSWDVIESAELRERAMDPISGTGNVLLVDDEPAILDTVAEMLAALGYQVLVAPDGTSALELFSRMAEQIDLVLLDLVMPDLDGAEVYAAMREIDPRVAVLMATGLKDEKRIGGNVFDGTLGWIRKPFGLSELGDAVSRAMAGERVSGDS
jgi:two-component system, cell cycle sensor histidine kinase and response regulator CckA